MSKFVTLQDCEALLRDHPPADRGEPAAGGGQRHHQLRAPGGLHQVSQESRMVF